jgi:hypothetical protein
VLKEGSIYLGTSRHVDDSLAAPQYLDLAFANRHGLITGATGTGKPYRCRSSQKAFLTPASRFSPPT